MKIHGVAPSPFVRKVRVFLAEKEIPYEIEPVAPFPPANATPEFRRMSPLGKVPALEDGDFAISDSSVICAYLERTQGGASLYPSDPKAFARALWFEEYADSKLADQVGKVFFNRVIKAKLFKQEADEALVKEGLDGLPEYFDYLEGQIGDGEWLAEGGFSIADIAVASQLQNLRHAGEDVDARRWPKLARWYERVRSRDSFRTCWEDELKMFASL
jgi:glutathione S-transferase